MAIAFRKLYGGMLLGVLVAAALLQVSGCGGKSSEQSRREADTFLSLGKTKEASELYAKAKLADPNDALALVGLGKCLALDGNSEEALAQFKDVIAKFPRTEESYWEAADTLLSLGRIDDALEIAHQYAAISAQEASLLEGQLLLIGGKPADAVTLLATANEKSPGSISSRVALGIARLTAGDAAAAEALLREVLAKPDSGATSAQVALVECLGSQGKVNELVEQFEGLAKTSPHDASVQSVLALCYLAGGQTDKADVAAHAAVTDAPASGWANYALGMCLLKTGKNPDAIAYLRKAALILPREFAVRRDLALARQSGKPAAVAAAGNAAGESTAPAAVDKAQNTWQSLWKQAALTSLLRQREQFLASGDENVRETVTAAAVFQNNLALARELSSKLAADSPIRLYVEALSKRDSEGVLKSLDPWLKRKDELGLIGQNALGFAMSNAGVRARALQVLWVCRQTWPDHGVSLLITAQTFRMAGMPRYAAQTLERLIAAHPDNPDGYLLQFAALRESGDRDEALRSAQVAYAVFPTDIDVIVDLSQACLDARQTAEAESVLTKALAKTPDDRRLKISLALVLLHTAKTQESIKLLDSLQPGSSSAPDSAMLHALALAAAGNWQAAADLTGSMSQTDSTANARLLRAACMLKLNHPEDAANVLAEESKDQSRGVSTASLILKALGRDPGVQLSPELDALAKTLSSNPVNLADFASGSAFQRAGIPDEAYTSFLRLESASPDTMTTLLPQMYEALSKSVRLPDPVSDARQLTDRHATLPQAWLGLARVMRARGIEKDQEATLQKAAETGPQDPAVFLERGVFFETRTKYEDAIKEYRRVLELRPDDPVAHNNLAYCMLSLNQDPKEAREHAQRALDQLPRDPHVMHTLGVALLRSGDLAESQKYLEKALEQMPGEPTLLLDFGLLLISQGKQAEGRMQADAALTYSQYFGLDFPRRAEAEEVLKRIPAPPQPAQA